MGGWQGVFVVVGSLMSGWVIGVISTKKHICFYVKVNIPGIAGAVDVRAVVITAQVVTSVQHKVKISLVQSAFGM